MEKLHSDEVRNRDYAAFISELRQFHQNRNTSFRHAPRINGKEVDLHTLYNRVTALGGWQKVNDGHKWEGILEAVGLPTACANGNLAIRQLYIRYLGAYEKIHFLGEDPDDDEREQQNSSEGRNKKTQLSYLQQVPMFYNSNQHELSEYQRTAVGLSQDFVYPKDYDKLRLSLMSGLPNEQDFALNIFTLLSNEGKHVLHLEKMPKLVELLIAQTGIWPETDPSLKPFYLDCWKDVEGHDMDSFWESTLDKDDSDVYELWMGADAAGPMDDDEGDLFNLRQTLGSRNAEGQRVLRVALILYNLSFESHNVPVMSQNQTCLRFLLLCIYCRWSYLRQVGLDTLGNLANQVKLSLKEDLKSRLILRTLTEGIDSDDRFVILRSLEILAHLGQNNDNDDALSTSIDLNVYQRILALLTIHDVMLLVYSLDALYSLSELGKRVCEKILRVHRCVGTLVSLLTIDPQQQTDGNFKLVETFETITTTTTTTTTTVIPNQPPPQQATPQPATPSSSTVTIVTTPQPTIIQTHQLKQQLMNQLQSAKATHHHHQSTTTTIAAKLPQTPPKHPQIQHQETPPICGPTEIPLKRTAATASQVHGPEIDSESVACSWLKSYFEFQQDHSVARNELYADYVSYCSRVGRKCVVNANVFSSCVRTVFPQSGLKRMESANGNVTLQHDGLRRRDFPLPVSTNTTFTVRPCTQSLQVACSSPGTTSNRRTGAVTVSTNTVDSTTGQSGTHSPILKAHLSSPLRSSTPPLTSGVSPSPPSSPGPTSGNTNLIKSLLASKVSRNIQKQKKQDTGPDSPTSEQITLHGNGQSISLSGNGASDLVSTASCRVLTMTPKTGKVKTKACKGKAKINTTRINGVQRDIQMELEDVKLSSVNHRNQAIPNHINNEESNSSESIDKELLQTVLGCGKGTNQNGLPTIKSEAPSQFIIPITAPGQEVGSDATVSLQQPTSIPRVIVISNNNNIRTEMTQGNTILVQSPFHTKDIKVKQEDANQVVGTEDKDLLKTVLASISSSDNSDEEIKRRRLEKDRLYKTSPLLNGLLDKGKIPMSSDVETDNSEEFKNGTKIEETVKIEKEDILSKAMAFAELDDEPLDSLNPDEMVNISTDQMNPGDCLVDPSALLNQTVVRGPVGPDLSSISDIARTLECASKAISRTNAECQLPFVAVPTVSVSNASVSSSMPATHIVSVVRINPQAHSITLPMMSSTGINMGQQIVQAHILRLQAPGMALKMNDQQELIRLPQLTAQQLSQLQIQTSSGENATILTGGTLGNAMTLKRPSTNAGQPTACFLLETKRPRQDGTLIQGINTKTPLLEASLRQSGLTVIAGPQNSNTTTQVVTVPAVMSADGQVKQQAQTFHLQLPKLQPKQEFQVVGTTSSMGTAMRTVIVTTSSEAVFTNSLSGAFPTMTMVRHPVMSAVIKSTTDTASTTTSSATGVGVLKTTTVLPAVGVLKTGTARATAVPIRPLVSKPAVSTAITKGIAKTEPAKEASTKDAKPGPTTPTPKLKYICQWKNCMRAFTTATAVLWHVAKAHTPVEFDTEAVCEWENCDTMKRKKLSLLTHLQDRHCNEQLLQLQAIRRHQVAQFGKSSIPPNQPPPPHPGYAPDAALLAIRRHALQYLNPLEFQEEKEGPLTKSIRLTASLVLRNLVVYCPSACSNLRQHEGELSCMAMSKVESSRTIAQCLLELARPTSAAMAMPVVTSFVPGLI